MDDDHDQSSGLDALSDVLQAVRLNGALFFLVEASLPWVAGVPETSELATVLLPRAQHVVSYHIILDRTSWCQVQGEAPMQLDPGDVVVIPHGDAYNLSSAPGLAAAYSSDESLLWFRQMMTGGLPFVVREGDSGPVGMHVVCGFLGCDALPFNPVLANLPRMLRVPRPAAGEDDRLGHLIDFAIAESRDRRAGSLSMIVRIGELMFVEVVRRYLTGLPADERSWLSGLRDPLVGQALALLHQRPGDPWTLEKLAKELATSRSVLAERFTQFTGHPPMQYLARWRMQVAARLLSDSAAKVSAVALEVGYESEAAFSRAFKKMAGVAPAVWRSEGR